MDPLAFAYWLQGFFELRDDRQKGLSERQTQIIEDHLDLVFYKITPNRNDPKPTKQPTYCSKTDNMKSSDGWEKEYEKWANEPTEPTNVVDFEFPGPTLLVATC